MDITTTKEATNLAAAPATKTNDGIQWAGQGSLSAAQQAEFEAAKARNWINERLIGQSQKHWNCTREQAIERLLAQHRK